MLTAILPCGNDTSACGANGMPETAIMWADTWTTIRGISYVPPPRSIRGRSVERRPTAFTPTLATAETNFQAVRNSVYPLPVRVAQAVVNYHGRIVDALFMFIDERKDVARVGDLGVLRFDIRVPSGCLVREASRTIIEVQPTTERVTAGPGPAGVAYDRLVSRAAIDIWIVDVFIKEAALNVTRCQVG